MTKDEVLATLRSAEAALRAKGVKRAALFGSIARGEARPDSDIDIMVELDRHVGVFGFVDIMHAIEDLFPSKVEVSERQALRPFVRPSANVTRSMPSDRIKDAPEGIRLNMSAIRGFIRGMNEEFGGCDEPLRAVRQARRRHQVSASASSRMVST